LTRSTVERSTPILRYQFQLKPIEEVPLVEGNSPPSSGEPKTSDQTENPGYDDADFRPKLEVREVFAAAVQRRLRTPH
jgi:hypothetical protein